MILKLPLELRLKVYPYILSNLVLSVSWYPYSWQCEECDELHAVSSIVALNPQCNDAYQQAKALLPVNRATRRDVLPLVQASFKTLCIPRFPRVQPSCAGVYQFLEVMPTFRKNVTRLRVENSLQQYPALRLLPNMDTITIHLGSFLGNFSTDSGCDSLTCTTFTIHHLIMQPSCPGRNHTYEWALGARREAYLAGKSAIRVTAVGAVLLLSPRLRHEDRQGWRERTPVVPGQRWASAIRYARNALADPERDLQRYMVCGCDHEMQADKTYRPLR